MSFNEQFDQHGVWRREFALRLKLLGEWMHGHDLMDAAVEERLRRLESQVRADKVMVAFVAEFSRGKSELINALFFADYGRRIMPASAGRTTMCPTELAYDADVPPCLRLLPIQTRLQPQALMEWRMAPEKWTRVDLDVNNAQQLAEALEKVAEVSYVSQDEARALGFWHDSAPEDNPMCNAQGLVEVPRWRHALINIAHPLLKQGLVILDTPGLNAIGAEPELTVSLIPQAHAVLFILAADTGVTKSDLAIWREHLITEGQTNDARWVVLNKIDMLWDGLNSAEQVQAQIDRQRLSCAEILGLSAERVIPVSAQKGLLAKVAQDPALLAASRLPALEQALGDVVMGQRQKILQSAVATGIAALRVQAERTMNIRQRDLTEQLLELRGLQGKNGVVIQHMRKRIEQEQLDFNSSGAKIQAVRSVHIKLLSELFDLLSTASLKTELAELTRVLKQSGMKLGVKKAYEQTFSKLRASLEKSQTLSAEIEGMLTASFRQLNADFSFSLQAPAAPDFSMYVNDLAQIERGHIQYLGVSSVIKLAGTDFAGRLMRALATRLRVVYESALAEVELWNKSASAQLDAQVRERRRNFDRRLEAIERIQDAASGLDERIAEIAVQEKILAQLDTKLSELTACLLAPAQPAPQRVVRRA